MKLKNISIRPFEKGKLKAFVTITTQDGFILDGFTIISGQNGLFVGWPQQLQKDGEYKNITNADSKETRQELTDLVLEAFKDEKANPSPQQSSSGPKKYGKKPNFPMKKNNRQSDEESENDEIWN